MKYMNANTPRNPVIAKKARAPEPPTRFSRCFCLSGIGVVSIGLGVGADAREVEDGAMVIVEGGEESGNGSPTSPNIVRYQFKKRIGECFFLDEKTCIVQSPTGSQSLSH